VTLLLDTHVVLWWLTDDPILDDSIKDALDHEPVVHLSAATVWEVAIKQALGKLSMPGDLAVQVRDSGFRHLPITADHALEAARLPPIHRDPFDRVLIAQARREGLTLLTRDSTIAQYPVAILKGLTIRFTAGRPEMIPGERWPTARDTTRASDVVRTGRAQLFVSIAAVKIAASAIGTAAAGLASPRGRAHRRPGAERVRPAQMMQLAQPAVQEPARWPSGSRDRGCRSRTVAVRRASRQESRSATVWSGPSLWPKLVRSRVSERREETGRMPTNDAKSQPDGFTAEERAAMKQRAAEVRAAGKKGAAKADGLQAVLDSIAKMAPEDRALAERVHAAVTANAPQLSPKTWYGMPAYANARGKVVLFFQDAGKFKYRYSTLGFQEAASLDDGDMWPVSYALTNWSPAVEKKVVELVTAAIS
jgi:PIN domain nuclease of toxin-antitoxin system/uncharacterized protein YdhG (YjbR/CyaY superfamily)